MLTAPYVCALKPLCLQHAWNMPGRWQPCYGMMICKQYITCMVHAGASHVTETASGHCPGRAPTHLLSVVFRQYLSTIWRDIDARPRLSAGTHSCDCCLDCTACSPSPVNHRRRLTQTSYSISVLANTGFCIDAPSWSNGAQVRDGDRSGLNRSGG